MHVRCPHCHSPIEVIGDGSLSDLTCSSCGSQFSLLSGETTGAYEPGLKTLGHFELIQQVGMGQFGSVWKAHDTTLDRTVAVKIPRKEQLDPAEMELFFREARTAAQLRHPNIVGVHEVGRERDTVYIVSDFVEGASLKEWLSGQRLTPREAAQFCTKIADALHQAHDRGIVHRDLKPANIMMDAGGEPHITDFGLAKREAGEITMTVEGRILGSPAYMSPEQARGKAHNADRRSDIYSLGVILFELLTGELPFRGEVRMLIVQILRDDPPRPRKLNSRVPRDLETITLKCLAKDPGGRYATAVELAADLRRWLNGDPIRARPAGKPERLARWCRRNPVVAGMTAAIVLTLIVGTVISSYFAIRANAEADKAIAERERADDKAGDAEASAREATASEKQADTKAAEALAAKRMTDRFLYAAHMKLADVAWENGNVALVVDLLERYRHRDDLRGFEWYYLNRLCHSELLTLEGHATAVWSVAFSPDGKRLASASTVTVKVWDLTTDRPPLILDRHQARVTSVAFSPDGKRLASASEDRTVKVWDATNGQATLSLKGHTRGVNSVAFSPDGMRLASASLDGTAKVWDGTTGQETLSLTGHTSEVLSVAFGPSGKWLASASADGMVKIWDVGTGKETLSLRGHMAEVESVAFSPDGMRLASASKDGAVKVWDATTGKETLRLKEPPRFNLLAMIPRNPPRPRLPQHTSRVNTVAFGPDGNRLASASKDRTVTVWDAVSGQKVLDLNGGHTNLITSVAFGPDGKRLASASEDGAVKVWDATTGQQTLSLKGHTRGVNSVAFSPDGKRLVSAGSDQKVKVWDATTGQELLSLEGHTGAVRSVAFSPDAKRLASAGWDQTIKVWDARHWTPELKAVQETQRVSMLGD